MMTTTFEPSAEHRVLAANLQVDLEAELAAFLRFNQTRDVRDPEKAFSGWIRRASRTIQATKPAAPAAPPDPIAEFKAEHPEQHQRLLEYLQSHAWWDKCSPSLQREEMRQAIRDRHHIFEHLNSRPK